MRHILCCAMTTATRKALGHRIRILRKENHLTQQKLALMVNVERSYLAKLEAGTRNPSIDCLEKIAEGLGVTLSELLHDVEREGRENPLFQEEETRASNKPRVNYHVTKL